MKVICLGGAGKICREAAYDLVKFSAFDKITIADYNLKEAESVASWLNDERVNSAYVDIFDERKAVDLLADYDIVIDGTTISLNGQSTKIIADSKSHGLNLNGFGEEYKYHNRFLENGKIFVPGFGMTPGLTNMLAKHACSKMSRVKSVRVSHGAFRPIAFSKAITETTTYEYDPDLSGRTVFENGKFIQVKPFARPRKIKLPEPYGETIQYIIPHSETVTLAEYLRDKKVDLIEVRGTWPKENMDLVKALYQYGFMRNDKIKMKGSEFGIMEAIGEYLQQSKEGKETALYGYALHVEVVGINHGGEEKTYTLTHTHPSSDGSVEEWAGLRAYTRNVAIPMAIGAQLIAEGRFEGVGALIPEKVFAPEDVFMELNKREIQIHEDVI